MSNEMSMDEIIEVLARYRYNAKHDADRIKALEDELGRMRADVDRLRDRYAEATQENARLKAEVERLKVDVYRLTEAGNNMWAFAHNCVILGVYPKTAQEKIDIWNAAKEGKQS